MFTPLETERLCVRLPTLDDVDGLHARRNDPDVARLQDWEYPYPLQKARQLIEAVIAAGQPTFDEWWLGVISLHDGTVVGDLALHLTWDGKTAEVGYSLDRQQWGHGYATEALTALVDHLFDDLDVTRVFGMLDPANPLSARVLERTGFRYEGRTKSSYWKAGAVSDDLIYGMVREDRDSWRLRPRRPPRRVDLVEVDVANYEEVARLESHESQKVFVAPMLRSFSDALFPEVIDGAPVVPWMRAIEADGTLVGFVMLAVATEHHPEPYLWRLLIDRLHQRRGVGRRTIELVVGECRQRGDTVLLTSWEEGPGSPRPFYIGLGFKPTGRIAEGETEARLALV